MDATKLIGAAILIPAVATLAWRFNRTPKPRELKFGRVEVTVKPRRRWDKPMIATIATTLLGGTILALERAGMLPGQH